MGVKVAKFGGSSLASTEQIIKAMDIVRSDPDRRYVVASAPGKRTPDDIKVTDLLYAVYDNRDGDYEQPLSLIKTRYEEIADGLGVEVDLEAEFERIEDQLRSCLRQDDKGNIGGQRDSIGGRQDETRHEADYFASRGEYLNSMIIAAYLGWPFVDAAEVVRFSDSGEFLPDQTDVLLASRLSECYQAVIPGFYGSTPSGEIRTFPRGGSDVTGALVARAVNADVYENWTDVSGVLAADPRVVDSPRPIVRVSYSALHELTRLGASVLHENAVKPVHEKGIPINIRNTNSPEDAGTWIQDHLEEAPTIIGIAGKKGFVLEVESVEEVTPKGSEPEVQFVAKIGVVGSGITHETLIQKVSDALSQADIAAYEISPAGDSMDSVSVVADVDEDAYEQAMRTLYTALAL